MASQKQSLSFSTSPCNQDSQNRTVKLSNSSESRSLLTLPSTLEVLGDHLYAKIAYIGESECLVLDVAKLTGILLECGEQEVLKMLQDKHCLEQYILRVIEHVPTTRKDAGEIEIMTFYKRSEEGSYLLHKEVSWLYVSARSMKTECNDMDIEKSLYLFQQIESELDDKTEGRLMGRRQVERHLQETVYKGNKSLKQAGLEHCRKDKVLNNSLRSWKQTLGELVFDEAEKLYPHDAEKLTGMVLELGVEKVQTLLEDTEKLHKALNFAFSSLPQIS